MKEVGSSISHRTDENVEKVWNLVHLDRNFNVRAMTVQLNLDKLIVGACEKA
jgi:hypothetical protein